MSRSNAYFNNVYANNLITDDSDILTYTPTIGNGSLSKLFTLSSSNGQYKRVGNIVFFTIFVQWTNKGTVDNLEAIGVLRPPIAPQLNLNIPYPSPSGGILSVAVSGGTVPVPSVIIGGFENSNPQNILFVDTLDVQVPIVLSPYFNSSGSMAIQGWYFASE
jgi:hypothetical protein